MTPDAFARCVTAMRGGEYVYGRGQLAVMARTIRAGPNDPSGRPGERIRALLLAEPGQTATQIARALGLSPNSVHSCLTITRKRPGAPRFERIDGGTVWRAV